MSYNVIMGRYHMQPWNKFSYANELCRVCPTHYMVFHAPIIFCNIVTVMFCLLCSHSNNDHLYIQYELTKTLYVAVYMYICAVYLHTYERMCVPSCAVIFNTNFS